MRAGMSELWNPPLILGHIWLGSIPVTIIILSGCLALLLCRIPAGFHSLTAPRRRFLVTIIILSTCLALLPRRIPADFRVSALRRRLMEALLQTRGARETLGTGRMIMFVSRDRLRHQEFRSAFQSQSRVRFSNARLIKMFFRSLLVTNVSFLFVLY